MNPPVIVDTNVVVAGLITGNETSPVALILNGMLSGKLLYLLSPALLEEYARYCCGRNLSRYTGLWRGRSGARRHRQRDVA